MKIKDLKELKNKDIKDLEKTLKSLKMDLSKNAVKILSGKEKNTKIARKIKKDIAQVLTVIKIKK